MKALKLTVLSWFLVAAAMAAGKQPDFVTQEATGEAAIVGGDKDTAKRQALKAAQREAVEQVVGVRVSAQTLTANSQLISDKILSRTDGYVRKYDIVSTREEEGVMKVTIRAQVGTGQLDRDLQAVQALVQQLSSRKIVILLQEQTLTPQQTSLSTQTMSAALSEAFSKDGWSVIDPSFAMGKVRLQPGATALTATEAKEIGDLTKADFILYGNVTFLQHEPPGGILPTKDDKGRQLFFFVSGNYDLALFVTDSGTQVTKVTGSLVSQDDMEHKNQMLVSYDHTAQQIVRGRGVQIVSEVRKTTAEYLQNALFNGNRVVMNVLGLADYGAVQGFKKVLTKELSSGLREMGQGSFGEGKAQFDLIFLGTTDEMAEAVSGKTFKGKKVSVTKVSANTIELTLAR
ncbi:MAG TPA: flagellar assembly protein T N-terminal domain-containing protein [Myxococcaceae bacterium]|jgi:hypothetical protein